MTSQARIHVRDGGDDAETVVNGRMQAIRALVYVLITYIVARYGMALIQTPAPRPLSANRWRRLTGACHTLPVALAAAGDVQKTDVRGSGDKR
jgi:hypothetical protein